MESSVGVLYLDKPSLRTWLVDQLEPITDADPNVLSEYILALLKHESTSKKELEQFCSSQLDDFLDKETTAFVGRMFSFLSVPEETRGVKRKTPLSPRSEGLPTGPASMMGTRYSDSDTDAMQGVRSSGSAGGMDGKRRRENLTGSVAQATGREAAAVMKDYCKDYHHRGFCARGATCSFQHIDAVYAMPPPNQQYGANPPFPGANPPFPLTQPMNYYGPPQPLYHHHHHQQQQPRQSTSTLPTFTTAGPFDVAGPYPKVDSISSFPPFQPTRLTPHPPFNGRRGNLAPRGKYDGESRVPRSPKIVVENIPPEHLNQLSIETFFGKFGSIETVEIEIQSQRATVTFTLSEQAQSALSSPEAIFGNRFVRVYRFRPPPPTPSAPLSPDPASLAPATLVDRSAPSYGNSRRPAASSTWPALATTSSPYRLVKQPVAVLDERRLRIQKDRVLALEQNVAEQTKLMALLDAESLPAEEKKSIMRRLRNLAAESTQLATPRENTGTTVTPGDGSLVVTNTAADSLRVLADLRKEAESLGIDTSVPTPRLSARGGRGRFRGGSLSSGRGKGVRTFKLDNRTKRLRISQLSVEVTIDVLRSHFEQYGEIDTLDRTFVAYKTREAAEKALTKGAHLSGITDQALGLDWDSTAAEPRGNVEERASTGVIIDLPMDESIDADMVDSERGGEDRERSWNR